MSNTAVTYLVAGCAGVFSFAAWLAWIAIPAWTSYSRWYERVVATFLSLYVLAAFVLLGSGLGAAVLWYYDEL